MSRDYKHKQSAPEPAAPGWIWLLVGLVIGLSVTVVLHVRGKRQEALRQPTPVVDAQTSDADVSDDDDDGYTFYDLLPSFEVVVPEPEVATADDAAAPAIDQPGPYVIQAGSFSRFEDADRRKAELALMGLQSRIQQVTIDQDRTYHRVRIGPIEDLDLLNEMRETLRVAGIEILVLKAEG